MPELKIKPVELRLSATDEATRSVTFTASTSEPVETRAMVPVEGTDRWEEREFSDAIVDWNLERFQANPVILWGHEASELPIGTAEELTFDGKELVARIRFASERANPKAEQIWQAVREGLVRAVSVGFDAEVLTSEERDGATHRTLKGSLSEISVVSVPADKDALIRQQRAHVAPDGALREEDPEETEGERKRKLSEAAKALSAARKTRPKLDADDDWRMDAGSRLDSAKIQRTQIGGIRVPARLARAGVFTYRNRDGSIRREYKPREVLAAPETIASFRDAPVIDFFDHTELMSTEDYRRKALGHVADVRMDGDYLVGELVINDASTIERIDRGERIEISPGYRSKEDRTPGEWRGQKYDLTQLTIAGNHIALCPPNRGRSGPDVGLRLDSSGAWCAIEEPMTTKIKLDGVDYEFGSEAHIAKVNELHAKDLAARDAKIAELTKVSDETRAKLDAREKDDEEARKKRESEEEEERKKREEEEVDRKKREKSRMKRALRAARIMEEDEEEKLDALLDLPERDLMIKAIQHVDPNFAKVEETDDYLRARFDAIDESSARLDGVDGVRAAATTAPRASTVDPITKARQEMVERNRNAWKLASGK